MFADRTYAPSQGRLAPPVRRRVVVRPRSMAVRACLACLAVLIVGAPFKLVASSAHGDSLLDGAESQVLAGINRFRMHHGLRPLRASAELTAAADAHSRDMLRRRYYAHNTLNGRAWNRRIKRYVHASMVGETLDLLFGPRRRGDRAPGCRPPGPPGRRPG